MYSDFRWKQMWWTTEFSMATADNQQDMQDQFY